MDCSLQVRGKKQLPLNKIGRLLIRGTNWIGDAVMTMPAVTAIRKAMPRAHISMLVKPWVAELFEISPDIDEIIIFHDPGIHSGTGGKYRLAMELRRGHFDAAILLQNAIEAAIIGLLADIPLRAGYNSDVRGALLTHSVQRTKAVRAVHQIDYYLEMVKALGISDTGKEINLCISDEHRSLADNILASYGVKNHEQIIGIAPGATYGPAKKWFPERYALVADHLMDEFPVRTVLFGSAADVDSCAALAGHAVHDMIDLSGKTGLKEAIALISRCCVFISNDSGLMHVAGALNIPTIAIFGSTNPVTTSPAGSQSLVIHKDTSCSPCLKITCPTDFRCMDLISVDEVYRSAADKLLMSLNK